MTNTNFDRQATINGAVEQMLQAFKTDPSMAPKSLSAVCFKGTKAYFLFDTIEAAHKAWLEIKTDAEMFASKAMKGYALEISFDNAIDPAMTDFDAIELTLEIMAESSAIALSKVNNIPLVDYMTSVGKANKAWFESK